MSLLSACSSTTGLSSAAPYNAYARKTVLLVESMPLTYDFGARKPVKELRAGTPVTIRRVFLEKSYFRGPIIPIFSISTQIFAEVEYLDPVTKAQLTLLYPLGWRPAPCGYTEYIISLPWEPISTPSLRYVGKDGNKFTK